MSYSYLYDLSYYTWYYTISDRDSVVATAMSAEAKKPKSTVIGVSNPEADKSLEKSACDKNETISSAVTLPSAASSKVDKEVAKNNKLNQQIATLVWIERIFLISICTAVAGAFTVPIIIYALDMDRGDNSTISIDLNVDNCTTLDVQVCL